MKNFFIGFAVLVVLGLGVWYFIPRSASEMVNPDAVAEAPSGTTTTFTLADIAAHNSQASCYTTINGGVYDLTKWIAEHPGGPQRILSICGKDGSSAFNVQHSHDAEPHAILATFQIGTLAQ